MSTDYNYDEQGQYFPFFVLTIAGLFTLPTTYSLLRPSKELESTAPRIKSDFQPPHEELIEKQRRRLKRQERRLKRILFAIAGWLLMAFMAYLIVVTKRTTPTIWDPYEVLQISRSSTEAEIKKRYKMLSVTNHPDKRRPDPAKNETIESISDEWVEVVKAFKTLTDEDIRNNYLQYGHPDGKQSMSIGIALPKFIVAEGNRRYVLLLYAGLIGVVLPYLVGTWWYGTQRMTRDGVLRASAGKLFAEYKEDMHESNVMSALSSGLEYSNAVSQKNAGQDSSALEKKVLAQPSAIPKSEQEFLLQLSDEQRRKTLALLWAYLNRVELDDSAMNEEKHAVAPVAFALNDSFISIVLAYGNVSSLLAAYQASQRLIQAISPKGSALMQLPYMTPRIVEALEQQHPGSTQSLQTFMNLPEDKRRALVTKDSSVSIAQYNTAMRVASQIPLLRIERAFFKVLGEKVITPSSLVRFVVKVRIIPPGTPPKAITSVNPKDLEDPDPKEGDLDALYGRNGKGSASENTVQPPLAHAPFFPRDHSPRWRIFLSETKSGKVAVPPFTFTAFDKPIFEHSGENVTPTCNVQTLKMQFQAPPQVGDYNFAMHLVCDSYVGLDASQDVVLRVVDPAQAEEIESDDEISEPEGDSLAGQMNALRGNSVSEKKKKTKARSSDDAAREDDSSDGSDTEGEGDNSDSDTDTDTDTDEE